MLQAKGVCLIIGLTHQGYDDDIELVSKLTSIDIIIGGHSHTKPETYPKILKNKDGVDVAVVQAFWGTRYVGYLEADFNDGGELQLARGELIGLGDDPNDPESFVEDDQEIAATIEKLKGPVADFDTTVLGTTEVFLNAERDTVRTSDTNLGSLICEAMVSNNMLYFPNVVHETKQKILRVNCLFIGDLFYILNNIHMPQN